MSQNQPSLGKILQQKRKNLKLGTEEAAAFLNVKDSVIVEIENDKIESLQNRSLYADGLLRAYAKFLRIDEAFISQQVQLLHFRPNTENKNHLLLNVGEGDKLNPTKNEFFKFLLISILLFLITLSIYNLSIPENSISNEKLISKIEKIDGSKH
jgi:cytoskeletal protein RodZ